MGAPHFMQTLGRRAPGLTLGLLALLYTALTAYLIGGRTAFPWDFLLWSESSFMTNMLKLDQGLPVFSPAAEVNSFVYSPGLEYLCYAVLSPWGLHLDARYCRLISVLLCVGSSLLIAGCIIWSSRAVRGKSGPADWSILAVCVSLLLTFRNFTAGILHADNLYIFHALLTLALCAAALNTKKFGLALLATAVAGLGILTKQTAALSIAGALGALLAGHRWGKPKSAVLIAAGMAVAAAAFLVLYLPPDSRFHAFELLASQHVYSRKLAQLILRDLNIDPHRFALILLAIPAALLALRTQHQGYRAFLIAWVFIGCFEAVPAMAGYFKTNGARNNLGIIDLWLFMLVWPWFSYRSQPPASADPPTPPGFSLVLTLFFVVALTPIQLAPPTFFRDLVLEFPPPQFRVIKAHYQYSENYEKSVGEDLKKGLRVLVPHGTVILTRNGVREIPLDRINSALELVAADKTELGGTLERIRSQYYDRIYLPDDFFFSESWYGPEVEQEIESKYHLVDKLPDPNEFDDRGYNIGLAMMVKIKILEPSR